MHREGTPRQVVACPFAACFPACVCGSPRARERRRSRPGRIPPPDASNRYRCVVLALHRLPVVPPPSRFVPTRFFHDVFGIGISIGVGRVYGAIADRASTDWRATACPPTRSCASRAVGTAVTVGERCRRGPIRRAGGTAAHAKRHRGGTGRRRGRTHGPVGASADGRGARDAPRLAGARVDGGLRGPTCASRAARVRRWVRIWSITDVWVMNATIRMGPRHVGHASESTSKICCRSAAVGLMPTGGWPR